MSDYFRICFDILYRSINKSINDPAEGGEGEGLTDFIPIPECSPVRVCVFPTHGVDIVIFPF